MPRHNDKKNANLQLQKFAFLCSEYQVLWSRPVLGRTQVTGKVSIKPYRKYNQDIESGTP